MISSQNNFKKDELFNDFAPDLTPLIDVLFMLIVFLMLTINAVPLAVDLKLPEDSQGVAKEVQNDKVIKLTILKDSFKLDDKEYNNFNVLTDEFNSIYSKEKPVIIESDKNAAVNDFMKIITFMQKQGVQKLDILTESQEVRE